MSKTKPAVLLLAVVIAAPLFAGQARPGWTKVELTWADGRLGRMPAQVLHAFGAEPVVEYDTYTIVYAPAGAVPGLRERAAKFAIHLRERDELDILHLPAAGAVVDTRLGHKPDIPPGQLIRQYERGKPGLFVLQFSAPPRPEWVAELRSIGWTFSRYIPNQAHLVVGAPELVGKTKQLAYVQWLDFFHPYQKWTHLQRDGTERDLLFELAASPDPSEAIGKIRTAAANGTIRVDRSADDLLVYARMTHGRAEELMQDPLIISVSPLPGRGLSDERQVMSTTSNLNSNASQPTTPGGYWSWVTNSARCPNCASMPASTWRVGLADTGVDDGFQNSGHLDLRFRKYFGTNFSTSTPTCGTSTSVHRDCSGHGTHVAGIIAGDASTLIEDGADYLLGRGVAPLAGVFSTKFPNNSDWTGLDDWVNDAASNGVTIQNHSFNEYWTSPSVSGIYSAVTRRYDILVRDADESMTAPLTPILLSVSAGNSNQGYQDGNQYRVLAGATAKNVLAMGGLENYRPDYENCNGGTDAEDFRNIMAISRTGTLMSGYIKPDLVSPASMIVSTHSTQRGPITTWCESPFEDHPEYTMESGTSFAAPVGAGAAIIVKRYLASSPADVSPALTKAMLIAGARSVRGGADKSGSLGTTVGAAPNGQQGFGRLSFEDILTGSTPPVTFDQAAPARLFTSAGQVFRTRLVVRDASKPVKVTLVWTDAPATAGSGTTNPLVNDLNLAVAPRNMQSPVTYIGNKLQVVDTNKGEESIGYTSSLPYDNVNNVEYARFFLTSNQEFDLTVSAYALNGNIDTNGGTFEQDFALVVVNADQVNGGNPIAPILRADVGSPTTTVNLTWEPAVNMFVQSYTTYKGTNVPSFTSAGTTQGTSLAVTGLTASTGYVFKVVANGPGGQTVTSNYDFAATVTYQQSVAVGSVVNAQHFTELRTAIDSIRTAAQLSTNTWAEAITAGTGIKASHMNELRDKLEEALNTVSAALPVYTYPDPVAGQSLIRAADVLDLRNRIH